ncbi:uncharacterized protein LOC62_04G005508 [Vanrija pseudolonga]|uniref:Uncharacterized protein n=1 Tax=Vanrija pseudolonga TaxID=143232 RepID=A0AAF1BLB4_9TREE|nr:hypothetical protein LOC62_04G005508 [Vanrija pseudolonga]
MPVRAAAAAPAPAPAPADPLFSRVDILHPAVATALRPVLSRAFKGHDRDCTELAIYLGTEGVMPAIVTNGCKESARAGVPCIVPTLSADWDEQLCFPLTRCVHCVLNDHACDLLATGLHMLIPCPCEWLIPTGDRHHVEQRNRMVYSRHEQMALPFKKRREADEYLEVMRFTNELDLWFLDRVRTAHTLDRGEIQQVLDTEGEFIGPNWVIPPTHQWHVCPCFPAACDISNHPVLGPLAVYDADSESCDAETDDGESHDGETEVSGHSHHHSDCSHGHFASSEMKEASGRVTPVTGNGHGHVLGDDHVHAHGHVHGDGCLHTGSADRKASPPSIASTTSLVDVAEVSVALTHVITEAKAVLVIPVEEGQCCGQW